MTIYGGSFVAGALMPHESAIVISFLLEGNRDGLLHEIEFNQQLLINNISSRKRKAMEIEKRFKNLSPAIWRYFVEKADEKERLLLLYLACLNTYDVLKDFHLEVIVPKYKRFSLSYDKDLFAQFLYQKTAFHVEIDEWTENTRYKMAQVATLMLKEIGMVKEQQIQAPNCSYSLSELLIEQHQHWFLDAIFKEY